MNNQFNNRIHDISIIQNISYVVANKLTNVSALSCPLGKSLFSNLIGYACNLYPFFLSLTFFRTLYTSLDSDVFFLQNPVQ